MRHLLTSISAFAMAISVAAGGAWAASSTDLALNLSAPAPTPAASISCPVAYPSGQTSFTSPVPAGTRVATCTVGPNNWVGSLSLSGPDASGFVVSGMNVNVGSSALNTARTYNITVTANP